MGRVLSDPWPTEVKGPDGGPVFHEGRSLEVAPSVFLTAELWGVGNSGPWLHDGRAASLEEAILLHGEDLPPLPRDPGRSEAQEARDGFVSLTAEDRLAVIEFLRSLLHFAIEEE
jgi:CxxC motif-containing protein (DUF1111 family)